jgi:hypothetical protein
MPVGGEPGRPEASNSVRLVSSALRVNLARADAVVVAASCPRWPRRHSCRSGVVYALAPMTIAGSCTRWHRYLRYGACGGCVTCAAGPRRWRHRCLQATPPCTADPAAQQPPVRGLYGLLKLRTETHVRVVGRTRKLHETALRKSPRFRGKLAPPSLASSNSSARTGTGRNSAPSSPATPARYGRHSSPPPPPTSKHTCPRRSAGPGCVSGQARPMSSSWRPGHSDLGHEPAWPLAATRAGAW